MQSHNKQQPMASGRVTDDTWPALPLDAWRDTYATLHMWTQVVGKICLALTPRSNHFWNVAFHLTSCGLATPVLTVGERALTLTFDFVSHRLILQCSDSRSESIPLEPRTVAEFYRMVIDTLHRMGVHVRIWTVPVEIPDPIRFEADNVHRSYDRAQANAFWRALVAMKPVFEGFRCGFVGKCSPVHFFWGSFDLAVTRFSGRRAPERKGADAITREAYSHEVISHGFWPGSGAVQQPAFYAYAAPEPTGLREAVVRPAAAFYSKELSEFILPYEAVRSAQSPAADLAAFLESTYERAATLARWNRAELERSTEPAGE
ncbi:MAG TPA: DUF5996 family protein [Burkholderiales bacterium]|nr:DUF5996 family protein [Burkholderiales bacterium]